MGERELQQRVQRIQALIPNVESLADPSARAGVVELVQAVLDLHAAGLERLLELVLDGNEPSRAALLERLAQDDLVANLLVLHGMHPLDLRTRVAAALAGVQPYLSGQGGTVEILEAAQDRVLLRFTRTRKGQHSAGTVRVAIQQAIEDATPDVNEVRILGLEDGPPAGPSTFVPLSALLGHPAPTPSAAPSVANRDAEQCELCSLPIPAEHRHVVEPAQRRLLCACAACGVLFEGRQDGNYRSVPREARRLADFRMSDGDWENLQIPINLAFFFRGTAAGRVLAIYPSPAGPTESLLELEAWEALAAENPVLNDLEPDVEALLVNRVDGAQAYYRVPMDDCYRLVGIIRGRWRGLSGGTEVWQEIRGFFAALDQRAAPTREPLRA